MQGELRIAILAREMRLGLVTRPERAHGNEIGLSAILPFLRQGVVVLKTTRKGAAGPIETTSSSAHVIMSDATHLPQ